MKKREQILVRCTKDDKTTIKKAVKKLDTTITEFVLVPAVEKAKELTKQ